MLRSKMTLSVASMTKNTNSLLPRPSLYFCKYFRCILHFMVDTKTKQLHQEPIQEKILCYFIYIDSKLFNFPSIFAFNKMVLHESHNEFNFSVFSVKHIMHFIEFNI